LRLAFSFSHRFLKAAKESSTRCKVAINWLLVSEHIEYALKHRTREVHTNYAIDRQIIMLKEHVWIVESQECDNVIVYTYELNLRSIRMIAFWTPIYQDAVLFDFWHCCLAMGSLSKIVADDSRKNCRIGIGIAAEFVRQPPITSII
jgi:hypothetical protein